MSLRASRRQLRDALERLAGPHRARLERGRREHARRPIAPMCGLSRLHDQHHGGPQGSGPLARLTITDMRGLDGA